VGDGSSNVWQCPIDITTGHLSSCNSLLPDPTDASSLFYAVIGATFATFGGNTYAYVSDSTASLWQCPIDTATGGFSAACIALTNETSPFFSVAVTTFYAA
jgi:hypothetical protein